MQNNYSNNDINTTFNVNTSISTGRQDIEMNPINPMDSNDNINNQNMNMNMNINTNQNYQNQNINMNNNNNMNIQMPPQNINFGYNPNVLATPDIPPQQNIQGLDLLASFPGIYIEQKMDLLEVVTSWEVENEYNIFPTDAYGNKSAMVPAFIVKEKSECCQRQCLPGSCREFELSMTQTHGLQPGAYYGKSIMHAKREYQCTFFCLNRPVLEIFDSEKQNHQMGHIVNPFTCCDIHMQIFDKSNDLKYYITGDCCQWGFMCKDMPCTACQEMVFDLKDKDDKILLNIQKKSSGCLKAALSNADNYSVVFPQNATNYDKALLMASVILIDYQHFEQKKNNNNNYN